MSRSIAILLPLIPGILAAQSLVPHGGPTVRYSLVPPGPQSTTAGTFFPRPLQVTAYIGNNLAQNVPITFTAPTGGPSATFSSTTVVTDAYGVAKVTALANTIAGSYTVIASLFNVATRFTLTNLPAASPNLALGRSARQSSTLSGYANAIAALAVDGFTDGLFFDGSVTHTNFESNPWWQVDLDVSRTLSSIVIWNRADCCAERLTDYWVFVSDTPFNDTDTPATLQGRANTVASHQTSTPNPSTTISMDGVRGRYVRVQLSGTDNLSLAEVQIYGAGGPTIYDMAFGRPAAQSTTLPDYSTTGPQGAVDGNADGNFFDGSVTHTNFENNPWWQVDLGVSGAVNSISIWNRTDCCADRLNDYWVFVSDTPFNATDTLGTLQSRLNTFVSHQTTAPGPFARISMEGAHGRYVRVQLSGANNLSLAEVQVIGALASASADLALGKTAVQSSTLLDYATTGPRGAVDGNTDGNFFDGSVTHTNVDANAWWQVDLGESAAISAVLIWNRTDACCTSRLSDYWVFVSNAPFLETDTPAILQSRANTFASHQTSAPNPSTSISVGGFNGRYVRVQLSGTNNLSLAEVQVFGQ